MKMFKREYYPLNELYDGRDFVSFIDNLFNWSDNDFLDYNIFEIKNNAIVLKDIAQKILKRVFNRFYSDFCYSLPEDASDEEKNESLKNFFLRFLDVFDFSYGKYYRILKIYQDYEDDLMKRLGSHSESVARFNDTPQDEGDFSDDEHTTNITKNEVDTETDTATTMGRINELQNSYRNIEMVWLNEFGRLFILKENIL